MKCREAAVATEGPQLCAGLTEGQGEAGCGPQTTWARGCIMNLTRGLSEYSMFSPFLGSP